MTPQPGDVLVSNPTAIVEYVVSIVGGQIDITGADYAGAVVRARGLAAERRVDAWVTGDHIHFLRIAFCRQAIVERA